MTIPVLFLAWYFPPVGGAGVQRSLKFVRMLPAEGFRPIVLAGPAQTSSRWSPEDASLAAEVPADLQVHRLDPPPPPTPAQRLRYRLTGENVHVTDHWGAFVRAAGERAVREHAPRAIFVTLGPYECLRAALALGQRTSLPVVADLRDPWAFDEMREYGHRVQGWLDRGRMLRALARCARVVMNTPEARARLLAAAPALAGRVDCITNGYDAEDFASLDTSANGGTAAERFRIVHTGYLHTDGALRKQRRSPLRRALLGGQRTGVDLWGRTHRYLLQALERLQASAPALAARVELELYGVSSPDDREMTAASAVHGLVHDHGYCSHAEAVRAMRGADLLFLPMQGLPRGERATIVPGKTYEYLASRRPILAAVPPGDARDFVVAAGGVAVDPDDVEALAAALQRTVAAGRAPDRTLGPEVTRFERRALTRQLAGVLAQVTGGVAPPATVHAG